MENRVEQIKSGELTRKTADRLKKLRESKGISHLKLSNELKAKYKIKISKSSLVNYEATDFSSKSGANTGMKIEYLRCLADFYGVPADFILGLDDQQTINLDEQAACKYTGLSLDTVRYLHHMKDEFPQRVTTLDEILISKELKEILLHLANLRNYCNRIPAYIKAIAESAESATDDKSSDKLKDLSTCQMKIYNQRQKFHGEQWDFLESVKKLADRLYKISNTECLMNTQYQKVENERLALLEELEGKEDGKH